MATTYTVIADDVSTGFSRSKKETAIAEARRVLTAKEAFVVTVVTGAGTEVFKAARRRITKVTKPYTKVITLPEDLQELVPAGYDTAYARLRNGAVVLRIADTDIVEDPSLYAVLNVLTRTLTYVPTTRDAGQVMKSIGAARKA